LPATSGEEGTYETKLDILKSKVDRLKTGEWIIFFFHDIYPKANETCSIDSATFGDFLDYLQFKGVRTATVEQVLSGMPISTPTPTPTSTPTTAITGFALETSYVTVAVAIFVVIAQTILALKRMR
jgi:hypothetical protein